jgi:hypothetical protein
MTNEEFLYICDLPDGRRIYVKRMLFGTRLMIGDPNESVYDAYWCYYEGQHHLKAISAAVHWDGQGDPEGWNKNGQTGEHKIT